MGVKKFLFSIIFLGLNLIPPDFFITFLIIGPYQLTAYHQVEDAGGYKQSLELNQVKELILELIKKNSKIENFWFFESIFFEPPKSPLNLYPIVTTNAKAPIGYNFYYGLSETSQIKKKKFVSYTSCTVQIPPNPLSGKSYNFQNETLSDQAIIKRILNNL